MKRIFCAIIGLAMLLPLAALAVSYGGITAEPAQITTGSAGFNFFLAPNNERDDALRIKNDNDAALTVDLYATDASTSPGASDYKPITENMTAVGKWIILKSSTKEIGAKESVIVSFILSIPPETAEGTYSGAIILTERGTNEEAANVNVRLAVPVSVRVERTVQKSMSPISVSNISNTSFEPSLFTIIADVIALLGLCAYVLTRIKSKKAAKMSAVKAAPRVVPKVTPKAEVKVLPKIAPAIKPIVKPIVKVEPAPAIKRRPIVRKSARPAGRKVATRTKSL